jgi:hypothetical protein
MLLLLVLLALSTGAAIVVQAGRNDNQPATAALVMLDDGASAAAQLDRVRELYIEGKISRILLAGSDLGASRAALQSRGVKDEAVIELNERSQIAQLAAAKRTLEQERLPNALLIAEPVETLRLLKIAQDEQLRLLNMPTSADSEISLSGVIREIGRYFRYVLLQR